MSIDRIVKDLIEEAVKQAVVEIFEPLIILKGYEDVEVLTLDEMTKVLRKDKEIIRAACHRGEIPHQSVGRDIIFPKKLVIDFLTGNWSKAKRSKAKNQSQSREEKLRDFVR